MTTLYVTGFGEFGEVKSNPTSEVLESLKAAGVQLAPEHCVKECIDVLHVSKNGIDEYLETVHISSNNISIHFGINNKATAFALEQCAYNNMDFRIPDMAGYEPKEVCIDPDLLLDYPRTTGFQLDGVLAQLKQEGFDVGISEDPGRYCCNYVYYQSLKRQAKMPCGRAKYSIFIHVPPFAAIDKDTQTRFVRRVVALLCAQATNPSMFESHKIMCGIFCG